MGRIIIETDCQNLKCELTTADHDVGPLGAMFREAKFILQTVFIDFKVLY